MMNEKIIQTMLKSLGLYTGQIDGIRGPRTKQAIADALRAHATGNWWLWGADRVNIALEQLVYKLLDLPVGDVDGLAGHLTRYCREVYPERVATGSPSDWRDNDPVLIEDPVVPVSNTFPLQRDMNSFYGIPGPSVESHLVFVDCPWPLRIAWNLRLTTYRIRIHDKCADNLRGVLATVYGHYGLDEIKRLRLDLYGGSYNHRKMRGGSSWSTHAYGAAIDWDPSNNALNTRAPAATLSRPEYDDWWDIWEQAGWLSLGRSRGYDWMHVQAARL